MLILDNKALNKGSAKLGTWQYVSFFLIVSMAAGFYLKVVRWHDSFL